MKSSTLATILSVFFSGTAEGFTIPSPALQVKQVNNNNNVITRQNMVFDPSNVAEQFTSIVSSSSNLLSDADVVDASYSKVSYYTTLGLYVMSFPGLWSQVKRSTTAKLKRKTYIRLVCNDSCISTFRYLDAFITWYSYLIFVSLLYIAMGKMQMVEKISANKQEKSWHVSMIS